MKSRFSRSVARAPRWTAALVTTLALGAGGAVAVAPAASAGPNCSWQPLSLQNGWQSSNSQWQSGDPEYCVDNGVVYLAGSLNQPVAGSDEVAVLPPQARPTSNDYLAIYTYQGAEGSLDIQSDGSMVVWGGKSTQYTSLAGISFPAAGAALQSFPPDAGYQSADSLWGTGDPSYLLSDGAVHLAGSLTSTKPGWYLAAIPGPIEPDRCVETNVYTYAGTVDSLVVDVDTSFMADAATPNFSAPFISLAGVSYPAPGAPWTALPLKNGWAESPSAYACVAGPPSYYVNNGVVYLSGAASQAQSGSGVVATLPPGLRPNHYLFLTVSAGLQPYADVSISPNGDITVFGGNSQPTMTSLSGISFQVSS
jgi:hypothetical protein